MKRSKGLKLHGNGLREQSFCQITSRRQRVFTSQPAALLKQLEHEDYDNRKGYDDGSGWETGMMEMI